KIKLFRLAELDGGGASRFGQFPSIVSPFVDFSLDVLPGLFPEKLLNLPCGKLVCGIQGTPRLLRLPVPKDEITALPVGVEHGCHTAPSIATRFTTMLYR